MPAYTSRQHSPARAARPTAVRSEWWPWAHSMIAGSGVACTPQVQSNTGGKRNQDRQIAERRR